MSRGIWWRALRAQNGVLSTFPNRHIEVAMKLNQLKAILRAHPDTFPRFLLPGGEEIPPHFHITEVGHVAKRFVDCGGTFREREVCVLQTYVADDFDHRLKSKRFADILDLGRPILPNDELEVEVEWDCCVISQYPIAAASPIDDRLEFELTARHTDCLAKQKCGCESEHASAAAVCC